jgi:hypothetical protein
VFVQTIYKNILFIVLIFCTINTFGQSNKTLLKYGNEAYEKGDFAKAVVYFEKLISNDSLNTQNLFRYAESLKAINDYKKAFRYYALLNKLDRGKNFPEAIFWEAMMAKQSGDYKNAKKNFKKAATKFKKDKNSYIYQKSVHEDYSVDFAIKNAKIKSIDWANIKHLPPIINQFDSEFAPSALVFDSSIFFSSLKFENDTSDIFNTKTKIYKSKKIENDEFEDFEKWEYLNNDELNTANLFFAKDSSLVFFNYCDNNKICEIWYAFLDENTHPISPKKASENINLKGFTATQASVSKIEDDWYLFFSSNRQGGKGGLDIWLSKFEIANNELIFSNPTNAGDSINSIDNEVSPYFDNLTNTLYFSSQWHENFGGFDIFKSEGKPGEFKKPKNLGTPFNTFANDFYFNIVKTEFVSDSLASSKGYFVSNREGSNSEKNATCCNDIYEFEFKHFLTEPVEKEKSKEEIQFETLSQLNDYLPLTLYFHNDEPNPRTRDTITQLNYLQTYHSYIKLIDKYKKEYSAGLEKDAAVEAEFQIENFFEDYVEQGNEYLQQFSVLLLNALEKGMHIDLYVKGYASPLAQSDYNLNLTKRRISSLNNYLRDYENGVFLPFFNNTDLSEGKLKLIPQPFGSFKAEKSVSDNINDQKNSVYSKAAALERKIEIIAVEVNFEKEEIQIPEKKITNTQQANIEIENTVYDFGKLIYGQKIQHTFSIKNTGNSDLKINDIKTSCGCTVAEIDTKTITPNNYANITIDFDTKGKFGNQTNEILIFNNSPESPLKLTIKGNVVMEKN